MQEYKRLFIGTFIKTDKLSRYYREIISEFSIVLEGKWVEEWNLHFTYHFLGDVPVSIIPELLNELNPFLTEYNSVIELNGLGCFPNQYKPRILFVNLTSFDNLLDRLHQNMRDVLSNFKFDLDKRPYHPHLTLLRIKYVRWSDFQKKLKKYEKTDFGRVGSFRVELIESKLSSVGPVYSIINSNY